MYAPSNRTAARGLRGWWRSPPRPGMQRLINPWAYRHLRGFGVTHLVGGGVAAAVAAVCVSYQVYQWAVPYLVIAALNVVGGYWYLTIARSASTRGPEPRQASGVVAMPIPTRSASIDQAAEWPKAA
jgi:hypothetical protein